MSDKEEAAYVLGQQALSARILRELDLPEEKAARLELTEARLVAKSLWESVTDEPFLSDRHLADVLRQIEKEINETND